MEEFGNRQRKLIRTGPDRQRAESRQKQRQVGSFRSLCEPEGGVFMYLWKMWKKKNVDKNEGMKMSLSDKELGS